MDLTFTAEHEAFRREVRAWIEKNLDRSWGELARDPKNDEDKLMSIRRDWQRKLNAARLPRHGWPRSGAAAARAEVEKAIFAEELARADAPEILNTPRHRRSAHPRSSITAARSSAAASSRRCSTATRSGVRASASPAPAATSLRLRTRAELDGDHFVLNGQKMLDHLRAVGRLDLRARPHRLEGPLRRHLVHPGRARHARGRRCGRSGRSPARASSARSSSRTPASRARISSARSARAGGSR